MSITRPHRSRYLKFEAKLERMYPRLNSLAAAMADTFDALSAAVFLVERGGYIVHANMAGHVLLAAGDLLFTASGRLTARDAEIDEQLQNVITANAGDDTTDILGVVMPLTARDGTRYVVHVLPLASGARRQAGASYTATAAVVINKAASDAPALPQIIAEFFKLTPAELRVLLAIVEIGPVPDVAVALGTAESTVRTHLAHLFKKTDTNRQADLVKLVAGFRNPLLH